VSSGDTGGWIIPWRDPNEVLREAHDRAIARMIESALQQEQLLNRAPTESASCPKKKKVKVRLQYLHANVPGVAPAAPVKEAKYVLFGENDNEIARGDLTSEGRVELEVDEEDFYTYYFHEDYASKGPHYFDLFDPYTCEANPVTNLGQGFIDGLLEKATLTKRVIGSQHAQLGSKEDFEAFPTLGKILYWTINNNTAHVLPNAARRRERLIGAIELFVGLSRLYLAKEDQRADLPRLWQALAFERLACCLGPQSLLISDLLYWLYGLDKAPETSQVVELLNSRGRCNAIKWLGALQADLAQHGKTAAESVEKICREVKEALTRLKEAPAQKVGARNQKPLEQLLKLMSDIEGSAAAQISAVINRCSGNFPALPAGVLKYQRLALAWAPNKHQQTCSPLTLWKLVSRTTWLEVKYEYADGTAVPEGEYIVTEKGGKNPFAEGFITAEGKAKVEVLDGKSYTFSFRHDPPYQVLPAFQLKNRDAPVDDDILSEVIAESRLNVVVLDWGNANFSGKDEFKNAPSIRTLAHWAVLKQSAIVIPARDESELMDLFYPVMMNPTNTVGKSPLWPALVLNRCSCAWADGSGGVRQALLHFLTTTKDDVKLIDLVKMLNSAGKGNAVRWLEKLNADWPIDVLVQDIKGILQRLGNACQTIISAEDGRVSADNKAYVTRLKSSVEKVIGYVEALVTECLKTAKEKLEQILTSKIEYAQDAALVSTTSYRQESNPFPDWSAVPGVKLKWLDVQYLYADGTPVPSPEVLLNGGGEPDTKAKAGADGFRHIVYLESKKFDTLRFLHDPEYALADPFKCIANPNKAQFFANLVKDDAKPLGTAKKKQLKWGAMEPVCDSQRAYNDNPTIGKIVFNRVRGHVAYIPRNADVEKELARMICFQLMQSGGRDWSTVAFLWLMTRREQQGSLVATVLGAIYRHRKRNADANPTLADVVKIMNGMGKGNAVRWLEAIKDNGDTIGDDVSQSLSAMLIEIRDDLLWLGNPPGNDVQKNQLVIEANRKVATGVTGTFAKKDAEDAGPAAKACIVTACTAVSQLLVTGNSGKSLHPKAIQLYGRNVVRQEQVPPDSELLKMPPWIALQYRYQDAKQIADAWYVLKVQGGAVVSQGRLSTTGFAFIPNPPVGGTLEYYFRDESSADNLFKVEADFQSQARGAIAGSIRSVDARGQGGRNFWQFQPPERRRFEWGEGNSVRVPSEAAFGAGPSIGKVAWWSVARNSPRTTGATPDQMPDADEMTSLLRALIEGGTGGLGGAPAWFSADNAEQNQRIWTSVALNRVGATNGLNTMRPEDGLARRAVLEYLEFEVDLAALVVNNHVVEVKPLIERLNKIGKGPAIKWLRLLKSGLNNFRDGIRDNVYAILDTFRDEMQDLHNTFGDIRPALAPYRGRLATVRGEVQNQLNAVFQAWADKLDRMVPDAAVRPYLPTGTLRQINEFRQPVADFPECARGRFLPVAWHLADPAPILLGYAHADGTPVASATFILYQKGGAQMGTLNGQPGRATFNVNNASGDYEFAVEQDLPVGGLVARAQPWANPYVILDGANAAGTYLTAAANGNRFAGRNNLPWGDVAVGNVGAFNAAPTLNRILADCVIAACANVSSANDVRDVTLVISGLLQNPGWRDSGEEWFRLGAGLLGTIAPNGAVQRGILLYSYNGSLNNVRVLLELVNWAGKLHAVHWLENEVVAKNYLGAVENRLTAILTRFNQNLNTIRAVANDAMVNPQLRAFLDNPVISGSTDVMGRANAKFATCFDTAVNRVDQLLQNANFASWKYPCGPGRTVHRQTEAADFLECGYPLGAADKRALITAADTAINNGAVFAPPVDVETQTELNGYNGNTRGMQAKQLSREFATMNDAEFRQRFNQLKTEPGWHVNSANIIEHDDGTLIRYKPNGDDYQRPPCPTYSVEVVKENYVPPFPDDPPLNRAAFKVDSQGRAVPKAPGGVAIPGAANNAEKRAYYKDLVMKSGHKSLLF
jgi:hypothetical protein